METWALILFDAAGLWLLARPSDLVNLLTANRAPASAFDRFYARLLGVILLWIQVTNWVARSRNKYVEPMMRWFSIVIGACAVSFLGYQLVLLLHAPKPDRHIEVDKAKRRFLLPESEEEAIARYKAAWRRYRRLRIACPLVVLGWLPFAYALGTIFRFFHWNTNIATIPILAWIPLISIFSWQWSFWQCPRCGYSFKGKYDLFFPKCCHYCELPMWETSPEA